MEYSKIEFASNTELKLNITEIEFCFSVYVDSGIDEVMMPMKKLTS